MTGHRSISETEKTVQEKLGDIPLRWESMAAVANIYRAAAATRHHVENSVLREVELTWTGFVVLWVVWIFGETETRNVAEEAGISKGTLTGVSRTLEARGLVRRSAHATDGRMVLLALTEEGEALMRRLFPTFNAEEAFVTARLSTPETLQLADLLRKIVAQLEGEGEQRRLDLLAGAAPQPRPGGRRKRSG